MTHRIGAKGQVVIPKRIRDEAGLVPGSEVDVRLEDGRVVLVAADAHRPLAGRYRASGMAARLLDERAREPR